MNLNDQQYKELCDKLDLIAGLLKPRTSERVSEPVAILATQGIDALKQHCKLRRKS